MTCKECRFYNRIILSQLSNNGDTRFDSGAFKRNEAALKKVGVWRKVKSKEALYDKAPD